MENLNNFYAYFPGGFYRSSELNDSSDMKIIEQIDSLVEDSNFDIQRCIRLIDIVQRSGRKMSDYFNVDMVKLMHHAKRGEKFKSLLDEMIHPIYKQMISLGYKEEELKA